MRTLLLELNRIHSHLVWLGTGALELGAISLLWYCFNARDVVLDLFELVTGVRMHSRYFQAGGLAEDIPPGFFPECRKFVEWMPSAIDQYETLLTNQKIWLERTRGLGLLSAEDAIALGQSGPVLRASGVDWDLRRAEPYLAYPELDFDVPVYHGGDVYDRYRVRVDEMRESVRIIEQCLEGMPGGAWIADDRKVVLPPRERAAHVDGVADPPLQDRHRGLPRARGRGLRRPSSRREASSAATSSRTAARSRGGSSSAHRASSRSRRRRRA